MATRGALRRAALAGCTAILLAAGTGPLAAGTAPLAAGTTRTELAGSMRGYHHLGATTGGEWAGVLGRITVRDPGVRAGTHDFVATRFMAKRESAGTVTWLEAGWAETGWSGDGRQRIYTFDSRRNSWTFYDQYELRDGDAVWLYVHAEPAGPTGPVWSAWLWWADSWRLLVAEPLPLGATAQMEQYVEVYVDPRAGGSGYPVPPVRVDDVRLKNPGDGALRPWTDDVPTALGRGLGRYCVDWQHRYDGWSAGDCPG